MRLLKAERVALNTILHMPISNDGLVIKVSLDSMGQVNETIHKQDSNTQPPSEPMCFLRTHSSACVQCVVSCLP